MRVLALDSSSPLLSCALWEDGRTVAESLHPEKAGDVLPEALLALAPLESVDALAAGVGPGSFTGLRVGLAAVKALAYARKLPVLGASSLRALALSARRPGELLVPTLEALGGRRALRPSPPRRPLRRIHLLRPLPQLPPTHLRRSRPPRRPPRKTSLKS